MLYYMKPFCRDMYGNSYYPSKNRRSILEQNAKVATLQRAIKEALRHAKQVDRFPAYSGRLDAGRAWRAQAIGDASVFNKASYNDAGGYAVMIVVDGSNSMMRMFKMSAATTACYIVGEALYRVGIPCRIESWWSDGDMCMVSRLKDWTESAKYVMSRYSVGGMSREAAMIALSREVLSKRPEEHKLLVLISDGIPNDGGGHRVMMMGGDTYMGEWEGNITPAAKDNVVHLRKIRSMGIEVMGIFITDSIDPCDKNFTISSEIIRKMHGNSFAVVDASRPDSSTLDVAIAGKLLEVIRNSHA